MIYQNKWELLLILAFLYPAAITGSPCSKLNRDLDMPSCLLQLKGQLFNNTAHWFGSQYRRDCPRGPVKDDFLCVNPRVIQGDSLAHRLFRSRLNYHLIDRFLEVTYSHGNGSYSGCGHDEVNAPSWEGDIDPLSGDRITAWNTRLMPDLTFNSSDSQYFTIIFYDVGYMRLQSVFVNVEGNSVKEENVVKSYQGPLNPRPRKNPYIFLVYKQQDSLSISSEWRAVFSRAGFTLEEFAGDHNLSGPVALNWLSVTGDLYSAGWSERYETALTCPLFVSRAMDSLGNNPMVLPRRTSLSVEVNVKISSPGFTYDICARTREIPAVNMTITPFSNTAVFTGHLRADTELVITFRKTGQFSLSKDFGDELYTLVLVDADYSSNNVSGTRLLLLVVNIKDGNLHTGDFIVPYAGLPAYNDDVMEPNPPTHRYYFLLYRQAGVIESRAEAYRKQAYVGACNEQITNCRFNVDVFVEDSNLRLIGANFFTAKKDEYMDLLMLSALNDTKLAYQYCCKQPEIAGYCCLIALNYVNTTSTFNGEETDITEYCCLETSNFTNVTLEECCGLPENADYCRQDPILTTASSISAAYFIHSSCSITAFLCRILCLACFLYQCK